MANVVIMPQMGQSVESCVITKWEKQVGDRVRADDILFTYETDKAGFECEAGFDGVLLAVFFQEQDEVPCLTQIAVIGEPGEDISDFGPNAGEKPEDSKLTQTHADDKGPGPAGKADDSEAARGQAPKAGTDGDKIGASPRARAAAKRLNVDLKGITPTGPHGRVIERDVLAAERAAVMDIKADVATSQAMEDERLNGGEGSGYHDEKLSRVRRVIARSMHNSLTVMAQLTNHASFDASELREYRKELKASASEELKGITYNDFVLYAVSRVVKNYPALNAHLLDDTMRYFDHVHLGLPVDTPRGLLVPTIFNADTKSLLQISKESKELAAEARGGSINPDKLFGASFTVSNLGPMDIELFTPIINPPQTGILGVGCMTDRVRIVDGQITVYPAMGISLTFDHRAVDGAPASRFLKELKNALEHFTILLAE